MAVFKWLCLIIPKLRSEHSFVKFWLYFLSGWIPSLIDLCLEQRPLEKVVCRGGHGVEDLPFVHLCFS